ncbi:AAA family ATPase [Pseudomonas monsensis]
MLIEFSVSNYRSFRERQTLSMVATPRLSKKRNVLKAGLVGEKFPDLLKIAAIYGPNASGKSSLIDALGIMRGLLIAKPSISEYSLPAKPFRFDPSLRDEPSRFEYNFIRGQVRYQYSIGITESRITEERLCFYPKGKELLLYDRSFSAGGEKYEFGASLEGGKEVHEVWRKLTGPKVLFLAQAVANSSEDLKQLKIPFKWFMDGLLVVGQDSMTLWSAASRNVLNNIPDMTVVLEDFLRDVDVPISKITFESRDKNSVDAVASKKITPESLLDDNEIKTTLTHSSMLGDAEFDFLEESGGTKNLIGFWLPWIKISVKSGSDGGVLAVDELDSSLHPEIVASLINKHLDSDVESQLIFTTHDTHLMNTKILRRDQFWITERDTNGATSMFSIHDFEGREGEDVEKRYFEGRYRGLPLLRRR